MFPHETNSSDEAPVTSIDQARTDVQQAVRALMAITDSAVTTSASSAERRLRSEMLASGAR